MENTLPSRFEETYCEKMKFDKYEYTNFIAYELARRNENVMNLLLIQEELIALYNILAQNIKEEYEFQKQKIFEELNKIPNFLDERKKRIENKISLLKDKVDLI